MSFVEMNENNQQRPDGIPCLLIYGFTKEEEVVINNLANTLDIKHTISIMTDMLDNIIEDILHGKIKKNPLLKPIKEKVIILNDLSDYDVHQFINSYKETGLQRPIYAVGTEASRKWTFNTWLLELLDERAAMMELGLER